MLPFRTGQTRLHPAFLSYATSCITGNTGPQLCCLGNSQDYPARQPPPVHNNPKPCPVRKGMHTNHIWKFMQPRNLEGRIHLGTLPWKRGELYEHNPLRGVKATWEKENWNYKDDVCASFQVRARTVRAMRHVLRRSAVREPTQTTERARWRLLLLAPKRLSSHHPGSLYDISGANRPLSSL